MCEGCNGQTSCDSRDDLDHGDTVLRVVQRLVRRAQQHHVEEGAYTFSNYSTPELKRPEDISKILNFYGFKGRAGLFHNTTV